MNKYLWKYRLISTASNLLSGKIAFKTKEVHWLQTDAPSLVLVSIHSEFHKEADGDLKMHALIATIKKHVSGRITVLFTDRAHLQSLSLNFQGDQAKASSMCLERAQELANRYHIYFENCQVEFWSSYICQDDAFAPSLAQLRELFLNDPVFKQHVYADAKQSNEQAFEDLLEQCACLLVLSKKGYRFQFYPGKPCASTEYINQLLLPSDKRVSWVDVFLSIEKKTKTERQP